MVQSVQSKNRISIRLTAERWSHIIEEHCELAGLREEVLETVTDPDFILAGNKGELLAVREVESEKYMVVIYREMKDDGFIITAFLTRRYRSLKKRRQIWPK